MKDIDKLTEEARRKLTNMISDGNVKVKCFDYYMPSEEAMDAIIKTACEKAVEWASEDYRKLGRAAATPATASEVVPAGEVEGKYHGQFDMKPAPVTESGQDTTAFTHDARPEDFDHDNSREI